jgi:cytochrome c oxidase subunit 2
MKNKIQNRTMLSFLTTLITSIFALNAQAEMEVNMSPGVTPISHQVFDLHMFAIWVCVGIAIVVYGVMVYSLIHHRKSKGAKAAHFHENTILEIVWTIIPFILLIILAIPATKVLSRMEDTKNADLTIKITGYQWKWQYEYLEDGISFFSNLSTPIDQIYGDKSKDPWYLLEVDKPLVVPINEKIRFLVTSNDVVHSWWVPQLGVKRDAIPGFIHESWAKIDKPGIYRGQCAELCGVNHGFMPIVVKAVTQEEFQAWVAQQPKLSMDKRSLPVKATEAGVSTSVPDAQAVKEPQLPVKTFDELMTEGKEQYGKYCSMCHQLNGKGMPPLFPALKDSSVAVGNSIARHIELVLSGVPGTAMQAFADQLTDEELAAIVTYERNAWGNDTGDVVQPADVAAVRKDGVKAPIMHQTTKQQTNEVK